MASFTGIQEPRFGQIIFLDVNTEYKVGQYPLLVDNMQAVNNEILNVLTTIPGERGFEPTFGSRVPLLLFRPCNDITADYIIEEIFDAIYTWLRTRVELLRADCQVNANHQNGLFDCFLPYTSPAARQAGQVSLKFSLPSLYANGG